jgi:hypothetical protein
MRKKYTVLLIALSLTMVLASCGNEDTETEKLGWGVTENGNYKNGFFDFEIDISPDYLFLTPQEIVDMHYIPAETEDGEDSASVDISEIDDLSQEALVHYVYAMKYEETENVEFNPYINIFSENMSYADMTYSKEDYVRNNMEYTKMIFEEAGVDIEVSPVDKPWIDGRQFAKGSMEIGYEDFTMHQDMYVIMKGKYALVILIGYSNEDEKAELEGFINTIQVQ